MLRTSRVRWLAACAACFVGGWLWGQLGPQSSSAKDGAGSGKAAFPMQARLGGNLYLQTSAEYRACCYQIYRCAGERLEALLVANRAQLKQPAVVMDLDETVFDNSAFQTFLYRTHQEYSEALWASYEQDYPQDVTLVPGAKEFISLAVSRGVTVVFLSNRSEQYRGATQSALRRLGIGSPLAGPLFLKTNPTSSDKSARREQVAVQYNVLMFLGDSLRDFSEAFAAQKPAPDADVGAYRQAHAARALLADQARHHWGFDWFVLPNPVYGEWDKLVGPDPIGLLHPTRMIESAPQPKP